MYAPKNKPAIQYKTKFAFHKLPVSSSREYCTASNPKGLKNSARNRHISLYIAIRVLLFFNLFIVFTTTFVHVCFYLVKNK